jgi:hypothetical protein
MQRFDSTARQAVDRVIHNRRYSAVVVRHDQGRICPIGGGTKCDGGFGHITGVPDVTIGRQVGEAVEHSHRYSVL